jgi:hypothetical protein
MVILIVWLKAFRPRNSPHFLAGDLSAVLIEKASPGSFGYALRASFRMTAFVCGVFRLRRLLIRDGFSPVTVNS